MATENFHVDKYQYEIIQDSALNSTRELVVLFLFDKKQEMLCNIAFVDGVQKPVLASPAAGGHINAQFPIAHFDRILDMLRNEKPIYFTWCPETQFVRLSTNKEPVGEQELRRMFSFLYI